jgi:hypothetical protein
MILMYTSLEIYAFHIFVGAGFRESGRHFGFLHFQERRNDMKIGWIRKLLYRINRKHKDMLFCTIFGREKYKKYALQLYNAVNKSSYTDVSDLEIITLTDAIYMKAKNDVAYLVSGNMAIYEHQSIVNPNMPLRG